VLFLYLHIHFHLKRSNDLEVYEIDDPSKDKLEEICDIRQPVIFDFEESEKMSYEDLMQGYEQVKSFFPEPKYKISMVHGKQKNLEKIINNLEKKKIKRIPKRKKETIGKKNSNLCHKKALQLMIS
jgi:hypothetical protein